MLHNILSLVPLIAPISLLIYASLVLTGRFSDRKSFIFRGEFAGIVGIITSIISFLIIAEHSVVNSTLLGWEGLGFSIRMDALSVTIFSMITILGFVILKFSTNYLDGDHRKGVFFGRLAATIAAVELLVLSGNLFQILVFWILTSVCLHYLLVFYRHRPQAVAAARKKFFVARFGDLSLLSAVMLLYSNFGTGDLHSIFNAIQNIETLNGSLIAASVLLVFTAVLKSAQFPTHGWLIEVVETPTPVSALLHAGLLNAGPFLMVRLSMLLVESTPASVMLILIGGFTALISSVIYLTQPTIKVSLGYSSVAHMGFSLLICGVGLYSAAILHIVAHSFYKAHSFLSSGSVIDSVKSQNIKHPGRRGHKGLILLSIISAFTIFLVCSYVWGVHLLNDFNLIFIGSIIVMGISQLLVQTFDSAKGSFQVIFQSVTLALVVVFSFLILETGARILLQSEIPITYEPNQIIKGVALTLFICFVGVMFIQLTAPRLSSTGLGYRLGVHLRNGLYANVLFDRVIGSLKHEKFKWANLTVEEESVEEQKSSQKSLIKKAEMLVNN